MKKITYLAIGLISTSVIAMAMTYMYYRDEKLLRSIKKTNPDISVPAEFADKWKALKAAA